MYMKKLIIFLLFLVGGGTFAFGAQIPMQIIDPSLPSGGHPYAPVCPWYITQDDNLFTLAETSGDYTLVLLDEEGEVVYLDTLPSGSTMFVLPSTLSGNYELRLIPFALTYYYRGYLEL